MNLASRAKLIPVEESNVTEAPLSISTCVCVCVREREKERERKK